MDASPSDGARLIVLTVGSLFTGIGGFDLGFERAWMRVVWQAEMDPYCCRVLGKHWPDVPNLGDVTKVDWGSVPAVDVLCGGYPCQPFSLAGRREGDRDPRHLWPPVRDAFDVLRPGWVVLENVPGHLTLGFGQVLGELAEIGYDTEWDCLPASAFGAPHRRDRVFIVAYPNGARCETQRAQPTGSEQPKFGGHGEIQHVADPQECGGRTGLCEDGTPRIRWDGLANSGDSFGGFWAAEPDVGRVAYGVPNRVDRLRALGNAIVPQIAEHVGRMIVQTERDE